LTPELRDEIAGYVAEGLTYHLAAALVGVHRNTLRNWLDAAEKAEPGSDEAEFLCVLKKAEAEGARVQLRRVRGGEMNWQSGAWLLERRYRDDYAAQKVDHTGTITLNVQFDRKEA
jgi:transposase-like protein